MPLEEDQAVLRSISWTTESTTLPRDEPPSEERSREIGL